jgi:hypothetical protein
MPSISDILIRTLLLSSAARTRAVSRSADYYLRVPIDRFGMLEFEAIDAIVETGYRHTVEQLAGWDLSRVSELGLPPGNARKEDAGRGGRSEGKAVPGAGAQHHRDDTSSFPAGFPGPEIVREDHLGAQDCRVELPDDLARGASAG